MIAVALAVWVGYRRATLCQVRWLVLGSAEAARLFPSARVRPLENGAYGFTYYVRARNVQTLVRDPTVTAAIMRKVDRATIDVEANDAETAQSQLKALADADALKPGTCVIRGRVVDSNNEPVVRGTIDLMGPFVFINHFQTRDDGTFTMPLEDGGMIPPARRGYYLRVRAPGDSIETPLRWHTASFSLDLANPVRDVLIRIPHDTSDN